MTDDRTLRSLGVVKNLRGSFVLVALALAGAVCPAAAQMTSPADAGFTPRVPVSGLAHPSFGFDPSRLRIATSVTVGSFGQTVSGLQVTSFRYQFRQPLALSLNLGNTIGGGGFNRGSSFFLEGLDLAYRPSDSFFIQVGYRDIRSPHQLSRSNSPFATFGNTWTP